MLNHAVTRGMLAVVAGLLLFVGPETASAQNRERGQATKMSRTPAGASGNTSATSRSSSSGSRGSGTSASRGDRGGSRHHGGHRGHGSWGHSKRGHGHRHHSHRSHISLGFHYPYSHFYWYGYSYPYWVGYGPYGGYYGAAGRSSYGALDLDVRPEKAEVYVNGRYVGVADQYDGFPTYLWLEPGTYEIAFYMDGFETVTREYRVQPTAVIDVGDQLLPGNGVRPEPQPEPERRDDGLGGNAEQWRERARDYKARKAVEDGGAYDARQEPGRLFVKVRPGDASIYLDGRFLGTAEELSRLHAGLIVDAGEHEIQVVHPRYNAQSRTFSVEPGQELDLDLELGSKG